MADDQVWIDPEFSPPPPGDGPGRWLRMVGIVAVAVAAFAYGWLFRSPSPTESEPNEAMVTSSTALNDENGATSTTTRPPTPTTALTPGLVGLAVPLEEALPGFTDSITMAVWGETSIDLMRWWPSEPAPNTITSMIHDEQLRFSGLDASGYWYAIESEIGVLSVRPLLVTVSSDPALEGVDEPWDWPSAFREAVAVRIVTKVWHDTEPGQLAWLTCWGEPGASGSLYTLDVTDDAAEPVSVRSIERVCSEDSGVWPGGPGGGAWLEGWGDWGFALGRWEDETLEFVLLDPDGTEVASFREDSGSVIGVGAGGMILTEDGRGLGASSFLLSMDGQRRDPIPGLAGDEWFEGALWSPDASHLAVSLRRPARGASVIRIVEVATGVEIAEVSELEGELWPMAWSTDGRFLFYERNSGDFYEGPAGDAEGEPPVSWVVYDTETGLTQSLSLPEGWFVGEIRTSEVAKVAEQLTPVDWGISIDEAGPRVHMIRMIVEARPLTLDQVDGLSGWLIWDDTVVDLCRIEIRAVGAGFVRIGDIFGTDEGCGSNPTAMQDAFDEFGLPETACVAIRAAGVDHEYCAPLS